MLAVIGTKPDTLAVLHCPHCHRHRHHHHHHHHLFFAQNSNKNKNKIKCDKTLKSAAKLTWALTVALERTHKTRLVA